ncbi:MAG: FkbM family methyltransferase [Comamonadaceae bacterium]|nr:MAG: FkbM family methyltransferase [Comamonadaceae bacterium]
MNRFLREQSWRHGRFFYNINDGYVGRSLNLYGEWAESEVHLFEQIVRPGDVVLEAGANIGSHTVPLAKLAGETGRVHAFEPQGFTHQLLCANLIANGCTNTRPWNVALGAAPGETSFPDLAIDAPNNFGGASMHDQSHARRPVRMESVDTLALPRIDFLKADIEGYEPELLKGARQTIERDRPVAFIESVNHYTGDLTGFLKDYFLPLGYQCWHYITPLYNAQNFNRFDQNVFTGAWSFDLLCTPRERFDVSGLANAETHPTECHDPELWRSALVTRKEPGTHA